MKFVSFHTHDTHSHADALGSPEVHAARAVELGMSALGTSNHGNTNNHAAHERACKDVGIKPIYGCEVYFAPTSEERKTKRKTHLTVFAMNDEGYQSLNKLITQSWLDFYQWPTVSWESLVKHNAGLVVLSGCADSLVSCTLLGGKFLGEIRDEFTPDHYERARRILLRFQDVFSDRFYVELQRFPHFGRTCTLNPALAGLASDTGIPVIATADVHYPFPYQNKIQAALHAARWKNSPDMALESAWEHSANLTYPLSDKEIEDDLIATGLDVSTARTAIQSTAILAQRCTVELPKAKPLKFSIPEQISAEKHLWNQIGRGWKRRCKQRPDLLKRRDDYVARIKYEYGVIAGKGFSDYFLVTEDLVARAKGRDTTVGPGRGSAAGSLISYMLGITEIDPVHPLFDRMEFSRFIDPTREDMPDIDLDFDDDERHFTEEDARKIYGNENVANIANHSKYRGKRALADICRAYKLPLKTFDAIGKRCAIRVETDDRVDDSIADVLESYKNDPEIAALAETFPVQLAQAMELEGNQHSMGIHACGFAIASDPLPNVCPIYTRDKGTGRKKQRVQVIPYEKRDAEYLGMLKMDFLGSSTMGMIGLARKETKTPLDDLYNLIYKEYDNWIRAQDRKAFKANVFDQILQKFRDDDVVGIMQFEGPTTRAVTKAVQPQNFDELAACTALSRPGPYYGGQYRDYVAVKHGEKDWERIHPTGFDRHVEWTNGQIVYQEQIIWILRDLAGFSIKEQLHVRKVIGKKLGEFQFQEIWASFRDGCAHNGISEQVAERVFSTIRTAAGYAFNTSHAYSYALIAWWQMWFKVYHSVAFFYATLAKNGDDKDTIPRRTAVLQDTIAHGLNILDWDASQCQANWSIRHGFLDKDYGLVPGFRQIPGIGEATAQDIVTWRNELEFVHYPLEDEPARRNDVWFAAMGRANTKGGCVGIGEGTAEKMLTFVKKQDALGINRTRDQLAAFRASLIAGEYDGTGLPDAADEYHMSNALPGQSKIAFVGLVSNVVYRDEIDRIREKTGLDVETIKAQMDDPEKSKKATVFAYDEAGEIALRFSRWQYPRVATKLKAIRNDHHIVVVWGKTFEANAGAIQAQSLWVLQPD
jgi:DNA polymerase-3 subunit alpha